MRNMILLKLGNDFLFCVTRYGFDVKMIYLRSSAVLYYSDSYYMLSAKIKHTKLIRIKNYFCAKYSFTNLVFITHFLNKR